MKSDFRPGGIVRTLTAALTGVFVLFAAVSIAAASVPNIMSFQGRLTDSTGNLLGGTSGADYTFTFAIYDASTGGTQVWPAGPPPPITSRVTQGVFNTLLGDPTAGYSALNVDFNNPSLWLEVQVVSGSTETLSPRQRIGASGYAINAETVHGGRFINATGVGQFGSLATAAYSRFGTNTTTHGLTTASQALFSSNAEFDGQVFIDNSASISVNLEVAGYASFSQFFGAGLTNCSGGGQKLLWSSATGTFSCGTDNTGSGGALIGVNEFGGVFVNKSSISFSASGFNVDNGTDPNAAIVYLDYVNGPASRTIAQTITGHWTFANGASFSGPVEFSNGASFSSITLGGVLLNPNNFRPASNSLNFDEFADALVLDANTTITGGAFNLTFDHASVSGTFETAVLKATTITSDTQFVQITGRASISSNLEVAGFASASSTFGSGLTSCSGATQKLLWNSTTGLFSCGTDQQGSGAIIGLREDSSPTFLHITSISFAAPHFTITNTASQAFVRLDWGAGGPASLSQNETVIGNWTFAGQTTFTGGASFSGPVEFSNGASFSQIRLGGVLLNPANFRPASNSLNFDEFADALVLDANTTITGGAFNLTFDHASVSGTFETAVLKATTIGSDTSLTLAPTNGHTFITGTASVSGNFEVAGAASASSTFGSGLTSCSGAAQKLLWNSTTGLFSCGVDLQGSGGSSVGLREGFTGAFSNFSSISFNAAHFVLDLANPDARLSLDWGAGGPASLSQNETVTGNWTFAGLTTFTGGASFSSPTEFSSGASFSSITLGGVLLNPNNFRPASNSLNFDEFADALVLDANTTITGGAFNLTFDHASTSGTFETSVLKATTITSDTQFVQITGRASISSNLEVAGFASASSTFGSGLTSCTTLNNFLQYNSTTGRFSCATAVSGSSFAGMEIIESGNAFGTHYGSISFEAGSFNVSFPTASQAYVRLDWGAGGPASLSQDETVTGHWTFANGASFSGPVEFTNGASFSSITLGGVTLNPNNFRPASNSLNFDEFADALVLDANTTITGGAFNLTFDHASTSGTFETAVLKATTIGSDTSLTLAPTNGHTFITGAASISSNLEVAGNITASGSFFGAGLTNCTGTTFKLTWFNGQFGCATDQTTGGGGTGTIEFREFPGGFDGFPATVSFDAGKFALTASGASDLTINLDWGAGGPASLAQNETVTGNWTFAGLTNFTGGASFSSRAEFTNGASFSSITLGGVLLNPANFRPASNSLNFDEFADALVLDANTTITGGAFNLTFDHASTSGTFETAVLKATTITSDTQFVQITGRASISSNLEVAGFASASSTFGSGLTACSGTNQFLQYTIATGLFSCGSVVTTSFSGLAMHEGTAAAAHITDLTFDAGMFNFANIASNGTLRLDWVNGPASRSANQTITGAWTFTNASNQFTNTLEIRTASISSLTVGGVAVNPNNFRPASNSLNFDEFADALVLDANTTITGGAFNLTFDHASTSGTFEASILKATTIGSDTSLTLAPTNGHTFITGTTSVSGNFEVAGAASASSTFGSGLTSCSGATQKLLWNSTTGLFSCGIDQTGSGAMIGLREDSSTTFLHITSISFAAPHFNITNTASQAFVRLDWGAGGPASLSQDETVIGHWTFANGASFSGPVEFANGASFSSITLGGVTLNPNNFRPASNSLDWDEFTNAMTVDAATTINAAAGLTFTNASTSGTFETAILKATTITSDTQFVQITGRASISSNLEVAGFASASATFGSGLTSCTTANNFLQYNSTTGRFSCAAATSSGSSFAGMEIIESGNAFGTHYGSISFEAGNFNVTFPTASSSLVKLDWVNGPASRSANQTITGAWTFTNASNQFTNTLEIRTASISSLTVGGVAINPNSFRPASNSIDWDEIVNAMTLDASTTTTLNGNVLTFGGLRLAGTNASLSGAFEVTGYASMSQLFGAGLTVCTSAQKIQYNANGTFTCVTDQVGNGATTALTLLPEYAGAVMSSTSASCTTCTGTMTSDNETASPYRNYYKWTTTQAASQAYDIWVKADLPNNFSSIASISVEGFRSSTNDRVYFAIFDSANVQSSTTPGSGTNVATSNGTWTTTTITAPAGTYTAQQSVTFRIRMMAGQNQNVRVGKIRVEYVESP